MSAPRPRVALTLESPERQPDGRGGFVLAWRALGRLWAELRPVTGAERAAEAAAESVVRWRIILRAAPVGDPRRPRPDQRLSMGEGAALRCFQIEAVAEADARGRWLMCMAIEETGA